MLTSAGGGGLGDVPGSSSPGTRVPLNSTGGTEIAGKPAFDRFPGRGGSGGRSSCRAGAVCLLTKSVTGAAALPTRPLAGSVAWFTELVTVESPGSGRSLGGRGGMAGRSRGGTSGRRAKASDGAAAALPARRAASFASSIAAEGGENGAAAASASPASRAASSASSTAAEGPSDSVSKSESADEGPSASDSESKSESGEAASGAVA